MIQVRDLVKTYPGGSAALRGVTLTVHAEDFMVILGRSGAGKSTLLRCMNMLVRPTSGSVVLGGTEITTLGGRPLRKVRARVGMIFQSFHLVRRLTVLQNVMTGRLRFRAGLAGAWTTMTRWFPPQDKAKALECLELVGIADLASRRADALSGGQQQRVAIARALAQEPELILADEPIASLDPRSAAQVMDLLRDIHARMGVPVVVNLHQVDVARAYASRLVGMSQGVVHFDDSPGRVDDGALARVYSQQRGNQDETGGESPRTASDFGSQASDAGEAEEMAGERPSAALIGSPSSPH